MQQYPVIKKTILGKTYYYFVTPRGIRHATLSDYIDWHNQQAGPVLPFGVVPADFAHFVT